MQTSFTLMAQNSFLVNTSILKLLLVLNFFRWWRLIHLIIVIALLNFDIYRDSRRCNKWFVLALRKLCDKTAESSFCLFLWSIPVILVFRHKVVILYIHSIIWIPIPVLNTILLLIVSILIFHYSILLIFSCPVVFILMLGRWANRIFSRLAVLVITFIH